MDDPKASETYHHNARLRPARGSRFQLTWTRQHTSALLGGVPDLPASEPYVAGANPDPDPPVYRQAQSEAAAAGRQLAHTRRRSARSANGFGLSRAATCNCERRTTVRPSSSHAVSRPLSRAKSGIVVEGGVGPAALAFIESLQPYHRAQRQGTPVAQDPLWVLHDLARVDPHWPSSTLPRAAASPEPI